MALLLVLLAGCSDDGSTGEPPSADGSIPSSSETTSNEDEPSSSPTGASAPPSTMYATDTVEGEIEADYLSAWQNFERAIVEEDSSILGEAHTGPALRDLTEQVNELIADGQSARIEVEHGLTVVVVGDGVAAVTNTYVNHSVTLDRSTGEPSEPDPNEVVARTYTMHLENGTWKIYEIIEAGSPSS
jgi:hypothetical protein